MVCGEMCKWERLLLSEIWTPGDYGVDPLREVVSSPLPGDCPPIRNAAEVGGWTRPPVWGYGRGPQGPPM